MDKASKKNIWLILILVFVVLLVVGVGWLIVSRVLNDPMMSGTSNCFEMEDDAKRSECLQDDDKMVASFESGWDKYFEKEDYTGAVNLAISEANYLVNNEECDKAITILKEAKISELPVYERSYYYGMAGGIASECGDTELEKKYDDELQALYSSGEVKTVMEGYTGSGEVIEDE